MGEKAEIARYEKQLGMRKNKKRKKEAAGESKAAKIPSSWGFGGILGDSDDDGMAAGGSDEEAPEEVGAGLYGESAKDGESDDSGDEDDDDQVSKQIAQARKA